MTQRPECVLSPLSEAHKRRRNKPHYVYQFWSGDECLYVGLTASPAGRISTHATKPWWGHVTHFSAERFPDMESARIAETDLIERLDPAWNIYHTERGVRVK